MMHAMVGEIGIERRRDVALRGLAVEARTRRFAGSRRDFRVLPLLREEGHVDGDAERDEVAIIGLATSIGRIDAPVGALVRSEEHTSELQSLMRISYAVFCLKKKKNTNTKTKN